MGVGLGTVVEAENAFYHLRKFSRHMHRSGSAPVGAFGILIIRQVNTKCIAERGCCTRKHYTAPDRADLHHAEVVLMGELLNSRQVVLGGAVGGFELLAAEVLPLTGHTRADVFDGG